MIPLWLYICGTIVACVPVLLALWYWHCDMQTYTERLCAKLNAARHIIDDDPETGHRLYEMINGVPHSQHLWYRFMLRNPVELYPQEVRNLFR